MKESYSDVLWDYWFSRYTRIIDNALVSPEVSTIYWWQLQGELDTVLSGEDLVDTFATSMEDGHLVTRWDPECWHLAITLVYLLEDSGAFTL